MLQAQAYQSFSSPAILPINKTSLLSHGRKSVLIKPRTTITTRRSTKGRVVQCRSSKKSAATKTKKADTLLSVKAKITATGSLDRWTDLWGRVLMLELVRSELNPGEEVQNVTGYAQSVRSDKEKVELECKFSVPDDFGELGAVLVENKINKEILLEDIILEGLPPEHHEESVTIHCNSWIASQSDKKEQRIFFTNKSYLPSDTPSGLKALRENELKSLRGDGKGERKRSDRIYDYDKYNDLGDDSEELARPVLGGLEHPYPRRCRTGRPATEKDKTTEKRLSSLNFGYVPRDETFSDEKLWQFSTTGAKQLLLVILPNIQTSLVNSQLGFPHLKAINNIYDEGFQMPRIQNPGFIQSFLPYLFKGISDGLDTFVRFDTPDMLNRDTLSWMKDEEFSRQTLAGVNPLSIQLVTEWPLKSKLEPKEYGPAESAITKELVENQIKGVMTLDEALKQKKLFILDYHDLLLPYVKKVRELPDQTTLYGSRTLFFLTEHSTLRPIAIELTRPPMDDKPFWRNVYTPGFNATMRWLWMFAKVHVSAHDGGYHQLVSHWLRTHCCVEPYIIASHRQLSEMHPIFKLLHPHLRYTMRINNLARSLLINAGGVIETSFSPGKYSLELSSAAYKQMWRFDMEALPADLIKRGMAVEDPNEKHGLKLTIEDYPFANDGLLVWDAIKMWITEYVNHYYPESSLVRNDTELQAWWNEIKTEGHGDIKDGWPDLNSPENLIQILTTIVWVTSGHHAAVNFGQYTFAGYFPNRPSIARTNMPDEDGKKNYKSFLHKPESFLMDCYPSMAQATRVLAAINLLSTHAEDEEYLGNLPESLPDDPVIEVAYARFKSRLMEVDRIIDKRNDDPDLVNRAGAGILPYELLKTSSEAGLTGKGVPNSISI